MWVGAPVSAMIPAMSTRTLPRDLLRAVPLAAASLVALLALTLAPLRAQALAPLAEATATDDRDVTLTGFRALLDEDAPEHARIEVLYLHGSLEQRAFTEGYLFAPDIVRLFREFVLGRVMPAPGLWDMLVRGTVERRIDMPEQVVRWCKAVVEGAKARANASDKEDLFVVPELRRELDALDLMAVATIPDFVGLLCSSFAVWGEGIDGGGPVVGRNLDYFSTPSLLEHTALLVHAPIDEGPDARPGYVAIGWPCFGGILTAATEAGTFVSIHDVGKSATTEKMTPRTIALQRLIETVRPGADTGAAALDLLDDYTYGMGGNALFAWAGETPGAAVFEMGPVPEGSDRASATWRRPPAGRNFVITTNHFIDRAGENESFKCWRFDRLTDDLEKRADGGSAKLFDMAEAARQIRRTQVRTTLYQVITNLATGEFRARLRRCKDGDATEDRPAFVDTGVLSMRELLEAAERGALAVPVGEGR